MLYEVITGYQVGIDGLGSESFIKQDIDILFDIVKGYRLNRERGPDHKQLQSMQVIFYCVSR